MSLGYAAVPRANRYLLRRARTPRALIDSPHWPRGEGVVDCDIVIADGRVGSLAPAGSTQGDFASLDLAGAMVFPCFVDMHTHLDKGHIWPRAANPDGTFMGALETVRRDRLAHWRAADVAARMDFALRCAYAHGTAAIRTHIDSAPPQDEISWPVFAETREAWRGRVDLQAVALAGADNILDDPAYLPRICARLARHGGVLGLAMASHPRGREAIGLLLRAAREHGLDVDLHLDETQDAASVGLAELADEVLATGFFGRVVAGHCCSLARQGDDEAARTIGRVAEAGVAIVSLPMCNLYLQDRRPNGGAPTTPRFRGVTMIRELVRAGVAVAVASDNTRDPFYAYGDLDMHEVLREATRIAHLDHPLDIASTLVTRAPAEICGFADRGRIAVGLPADLLLFEGRDWSEILSRPECRRVVLRGGRAIARELPSFRELDAMMEN